MIQVITPDGVNSWDFYISEETKSKVAASGAQSIMLWWNAEPVEKYMTYFLLQTIAMMGGGGDRDSGGGEGDEDDGEGGSDDGGGGGHHGNHEMGRTGETGDDYETKDAAVETE